jgi:predicted dehydrogenase
VAETYRTRAFATIAELSAACAALSVAVPTDRHCEVVTDLLRQGKHVLVEKPIASSVAQGRELVALARERQRVLMVGHVERFNPVITFLEAHLDQPRFIEAHRLAKYPPPRPGLRPRGTEVGVVFDLMIHDLDVILHLVKSEVERVDAVGIAVLSPTEDIANARLTFANGCVANITASRVSQEVMRKLRVFQSDAYLSLDYQEQKGEVVLLKGHEIVREPVPIEPHNALQRELADFVRCVAEAQITGAVPKPTVSGEHAQRALEIADQILHAIAENQRKALPRA